MQNASTSSPTGAGRAPAVATHALTRAFGWTGSDSFAQHDVSELLHLLLDKLETALGDRAQELRDLTQIKTQGYVRCTEIDYTSTRDDVSVVLNLPVKGCATLRDSFDALLRPERLDGSNLYDAGPGRGRQPAEMGTRLLSLPPFLFLALRRFDIDMLTGRAVKLHSRLEYPEKLDLSSHTSNPRDRYSLHSVLVHGGSLHGGHYYVYCIPPEAESPGYVRFNDRRVDAASREQAVADPAGGTDKRSASRSLSSAYLLCYVRDADAPKALPRVPAPVPAALATQLALATELEVAEEQRRREAELLVSVPVFTLPLLRERARGPGLVSDGVTVTVQVSRLRALEHACPAIGQLSCGAQTNPLTIWRCATRRNGTVRPTQPVSESMLTAPLGRGLAGFPAQNPVVPPVFAHRLATHQAPTSLVFVKAYLPGLAEVNGNAAVATDCLRVADVLLLTKEAVLADFMPAFRAALVDAERRLLGRMVTSADAELMLFEELTDARANVLDPTCTVHALGLRHGDVIVVASVPSEASSLEDMAAEAAAAMSGGL
jgi:hypothetical protein